MKSRAVGLFFNYKFIKDAVSFHLTYFLESVGNLWLIFFSYSAVQGLIEQQDASVLRSGVWILNLDPGLNPEPTNGR